MTGCLAFPLALAWFNCHAGQPPESPLARPLWRPLSPAVGHEVATRRGWSTIGIFVSGHSSKLPCCRRSHSRPLPTSAFAHRATNIQWASGLISAAPRAPPPLRRTLSAVLPCGINCILRLGPARRRGKGIRGIRLKPVVQITTNYRSMALKKQKRHG
jgi:hypothetical protein